VPGLGDRWDDELLLEDTPVPRRDAKPMTAEAQSDFDSAELTLVDPPLFPPPDLAARRTNAHVMPRRDSRPTPPPPPAAPRPTAAMRPRREPPGSIVGPATRAPRQDAASSPDTQQPPRQGATSLPVQPPPRRDLAPSPDVQHPAPPTSRRASSPSLDPHPAAGPIGPRRHFPPVPIMFGDTVGFSPGRRIPDGTPDPWGAWPDGLEGTQPRPARYAAPADRRAAPDASLSRLVWLSIAAALLMIAALATWVIH
jgi:hypothetical protein